MASSTGNEATRHLGNQPRALLDVCRGQVQFPDNNEHSYVLPYELREFYRPMRDPVTRRVVGLSYAHKNQIIPEKIVLAVERADNMRKAAIRAMYKLKKVVNPSMTDHVYVRSTELSEDGSWVFDMCGATRIPDEPLLAKFANLALEAPPTLQTARTLARYLRVYAALAEAKRSDVLHQLFRDATDSEQILRRATWVTLPGNAPVEEHNLLNALTTLRFARMGTRELALAFDDASLSYERA